MPSSAGTRNERPKPKDGAVKSPLPVAKVEVVPIVEAVPVEAVKIEKKKAGVRGLRWILWGRVRVFFV